MDEIEVHVTGLLTPAAPRPRISVSVDAIALSRTGTGVVSSRRVEPADRSARDTAVAVLERTAHDAREAGVRLQSTVVDVAGSVRVLARVETVGGPVLLGTEGPTALPFGELGGLPDRLAPAGDVRDLPIVLRPGVAAVLIAGAVFSLTSAKGRDSVRRLAGKRVLPGLSLSVAGRPLVDGGVLLAQDDEPRRVWDHERQSYVDDPLTRAAVRGHKASLPDDFVELVWCVEGLQRYHADGTVRLQCLARTGGDWSVRTLVGKPIRLLRHVTAVHGPLTTVFTDSVVTTQSLVLTSARTIEEKGNGRIIEE